VRVVLHTGKGGVGKTSLSAATALGAAQHGHRVFLLSTDSAHSLGDALGEAVGPAPIEVAEGLVAQEVDALTELDRSWSSIKDWLRELLRSDTDDMVAEELLVFPGLEELVALRAIREVEATGEYDVCVVDCAPTGSTLRMLRFPDVLRIFMENFFDWKRKAAKAIRPIAATFGADVYVPSDDVFATFERLYREVEDVRSILLDTDRTSARLVVNPARVVIDETRRSFAYLSLYGLGAARTHRTRGDRAFISGATIPRPATFHRAHRGGSPSRTRSRDLWRSGSRSALHPRSSDSTRQTRRSDRDGNRSRSRVDR